MPKALGIVSLVFGILSFITALGLILLLLMMRVFPLISLLDIVLGLLAFIFGIVGAATAKGRYSKAPSIVGLVFGALVLSLAFMILTPA